MSPKSIDRELGEIVAKLEGLQSAVDTGFARADARFDKLEIANAQIDSRVRHVEQRSAIFGSVAGGIVGVTVSIITANIRQIGGV